MPIIKSLSIHLVNLIGCILLIFSTNSFSEDSVEKSKKTNNDEKLIVNITEDLPFLDVNHNGKTIRIQRVQDIHYKLTNSFAKTSRQCPPFCLHPIKLKLPGNIKTVGELEVLAFLKGKVPNNKGLLIDARLTDWYEKGTIPSATSVPFTLFTGGVDDDSAADLLTLLGVKENEEDDDERLFHNAIDLMFFGNGAWSGQAPKAIQHLLQMGYPAQKITWYRGGMQTWLLFGLTTVKP